VGRTLTVMVAAPAVIGMATGACVAGASLVVEGVVLGRVSALPGLLPVACALVALLLTLAVSVYVMRVARPSTAELYITTYHDPQAHIPLRQLPGRVLAAATTVGLGGARVSSRRPRSWARLSATFSGVPASAPPRRVR
jgi:H+/Cl- antiporter ClcA